MYRNGNINEPISNYEYNIAMLQSQCHVHNIAMLQSQCYVHNIAMLQSQCYLHNNTQKQDSYIQKVAQTFPDCLHGAHIFTPWLP